MRLPVIALATLLPCLAAAPQIDKAKAYGTPGAPVTIEIFSDFACPHCRDLHDHVVPLLMRDLVVPGKVYLVLREYPFLTNHSQEAACFAVAAARVGKYRPVANALYETQAKWATEGNVWGSVSSAVTDPKERKRIETLAKDPEVVGEVQREKAEGVACGVTGTPTLLVSHAGKSIRFDRIDASNYPFFRQYLDGLAKK